ncbi:MAG: aspartate carbamoyltransferase catalytic subunit [Sedimentisphaerales bacterium]|nr:aspartate carbamoyltransferase catalytic subunit [Sedimentisphaerales bacterium]
MVEKTIEKRSVKTTTKNTPKFIWRRKHLLGLQDLSREELIHILDTAKGFKGISKRSVKKAPTLRGKVVVNLFFEDSTRTRNSFTLAASRLSADVLEFTAKTSSVSKGETLRDTARNLEAMGIDIVVIRHSAGGAPHLLTRCIDACIINAGDGYHEHPTQGLLDIFSIRELRPDLSGLKVAIVGDIAHSRVARSNIWGLHKLGAEVYLVAPPTLMPSGIEKMPVTPCYNFDEIIGQMDVLNMLRVQFERIGSSVFPSVLEYSRLFGLTVERMKRAKKDVIVMHPGPLNRGLEIESEVADGPNSTILQQVSNGVAVRMAVLFLVNQAVVLEKKK